MSDDALSLKKPPMYFVRRSPDLPLHIVRERRHQAAVTVTWCGIQVADEQCLMEQHDTDSQFWSWSGVCLRCRSALDKPKLLSGRAGAQNRVMGRDEPG